MDLIAYTDGSAMEDKLSSWAYVIVNGKGEEVKRDSGVLRGDICQIRNIGGELVAVMEAVKWAKENKKKIKIKHDLESIERWATGKWKRNNKWTKEYYKFMQENNDTILGFEWVKSHHVDLMNNLVDQIASNTLSDGLEGIK